MVRFLLFVLVSILVTLPRAECESLVGAAPDNRLFLIDSDDPASAEQLPAVTGLQTGEHILGIDFRPANNKLYLLGSSSRLYTLNLNTGVATALGAAAFTPALTGTAFAFDFNPVADRVRIIGNDGQSLRADPDTGLIAATDTSLTFDPGDPNAGATPAVTGAAYSNSFVGAATTTLFGIDSGTDSLVLVGGVAGSPSPNSGVLTTVAPLGIAVGADIGLDFSAFTGKLYLSALRTAQSVSELYTIDLGTSASMQRLGFIGSTAISGLAVAPFEDNPPSVTVTKPAAAKVRTKATSYVLQGTATDDVLVKAVHYTLTTAGRKSAIKDATGSATWQIRVSGLRNGRPVIVDIFAEDLSGNFSAVKRITITPARTPRSSSRR